MVSAVEGFLTIGAPRKIGRNARLRIACVKDS